MKKSLRNRTVTGLLCLGLITQTASYLPAKGETKSMVTVNEVCTKNTTYQTADGNCYDWIELYNSGKDEADISGWGLSDKEDKPYRYVFPEGTHIPASGRLVVFCDSDAGEGNDSIVPFGLSTSGETITLTDAEGNTAQTVTVGALASDTSYGQYPDGSGEFYTLSCTPDQANSAPEGSNAVHQPEFSSDSGFYDNSFSLTLTADEGCRIFYTTDGSDPTAESEEYTGPITIEDMSGTDNRLSARTDIVPGNASAPRNKVDKAAVIRAVSVDSEGRVSAPVTKTYFIGNTNSGYYKEMKVVSLVTDPDNLFDYEKGIYCLGQIYGGKKEDEKPKEEDHPKEEDRPKEEDIPKEGERPEDGKQDPEGGDNRVQPKRAGNIWEMPANYTQRGREWEREANFTLFDGGEKVLEQNVGIRIKGNYSRCLPQKSFNVYTRQDYGSSEFSYDFFDGKATKAKNGKAIKKYDGLVLRNGGNDNTYAFFRDSINQSLITDRDFAYQATTECIVFIDGEFWGIYQMMEKINTGYISEHYGVKKSSVAMIKNGELEDGTDEDLSDWSALCKGVANGSISYEEFCNKVDLQGFMDYFAAQIYWANADWPQRNYIAWRSDAADETNPYADGKWRMVLFDTESGQGLYGSNDKSFSADCYRRISGTNSDIGKMFTALSSNDEFRLAFSRTMMDLANYNFTPERTKAVINGYKNKYKEQVLDTFERFQSGSLSGSNGERKFENEISTVINFYNQRYTYAEKSTRSAMKLAAAPYKLTVRNSKDNGSIRLNTLALGKINEWSGSYHADYALTLTAEPEEGRTFSHWEISGASITEGDKNSETISIKLESDAMVKAVYDNDPKKGDVNSDGSFDVADLVLLQKWLLADSSAVLSNCEAADMYFDGVIDVFDLVSMKKELIAGSAEKPAAE
ncbi:MAG: CotH kinase family protein [Ruminococcus sp.]|nr:CotH kinase family protein [Ruminococcus sp.]